MARWRTRQLSLAARNPGRDSALGAWQWRVKPSWLLISVLFASDFSVALKLLGVFWDFMLGCSVQKYPEHSSVPASEIPLKTLQMFVGVNRNPPQKSCNFCGYWMVSSVHLCLLYLSPVSWSCIILRSHSTPLNLFGHYKLTLDKSMHCICQWGEPVRAHLWPHSAASFPSPVEVGAVPCHSKRKKCWSQGGAKCSQWKLLLTGRSGCLAFGSASSCLLHLLKKNQTLWVDFTIVPVSPLLG